MEGTQGTVGNRFGQSEGIAPEQDDVPEHDRIGDQGEGAELAFLALAIRLSDFAAPAVADGPDHPMAALAAVDLREDTTPSCKGAGPQGWPPADSCRRSAGPHRQAPAPGPRPEYQPYLQDAGHLQAHVLSVSGAARCRCEKTHASALAQLCVPMIVTARIPPVTSLPRNIVAPDFGVH